MVCDCKDERWVEWVRVKVEEKVICSVCHRDIPPNDLVQTEQSDGSIAFLPEPKK